MNKGFINNKGFDDEETIGLNNKVQEKKEVLIDDSEYVEVQNDIKNKEKADYTSIWKAFFDNERHDFLNLMGYKTSDIVKIGIKDFIDKMGWTDVSQVSSYKTDMMHVTICSECQKEFCVYEENHGLCDNCASQYDIRYFDAYYSEFIKINDLNSAAMALTMFEAYKDYRLLYTPKAITSRIYMSLVKSNFTNYDAKTFLQKQLIMLLQKNKKAKKKDFINMIISNFTSPYKYNKNIVLEIDFEALSPNTIRENLEEFLSFKSSKNWASQFLKKLSS